MPVAPARALANPPGLSAEALVRALEGAPPADPQPPAIGPRAAPPAPAVQNPPAALPDPEALPAPELPAPPPVLSEPGLPAAAPAGPAPAAASPLIAPPPAAPAPAVTVAQVPAAVAAAANAAPDGTVEITLDPVELGTLTITFRSEGEGLRIVIFAERPETLDLMRRNAGEFLADLRAQGFGQASLGFAGGQGSGAGTPYPQPDAMRPAPPAEAGTRPAPPVPAFPAQGLNLRL